MLTPTAPWAPLRPGAPIPRARGSPDYRADLPGPPPTLRDTPNPRSVPDGTELRSHTPSFSSLSRISQLNMPAFSRLYSSIFFSTSGVVTCFSEDKASGHSL